MRLKVLTKVTFWAVVFTALVTKIGLIPMGLFCDEALIGLTSKNLFSGSALVSPFFYQHFDYLVGSLPLYATFPFTWLLGLSEESVRLGSAVYAFGSLLILNQILYELKLKGRYWIILLTTFSPIFFHLSRINFGHLPSFFFLNLGLWLFLRAKSGSIWLAIGSGLTFALAAYGYSGFVLFTPLFVGCLGLREILLNGRKFGKYRPYFVTWLVFFLLLIPLFYTAFTNPTYQKRLQDKTIGQTGFFSIGKVKEVIKNYPKYYNPRYLFTEATVDQGDYITRHSIAGQGVLLPISALFLLTALGAVLLGYHRKEIFPFVFALLAYPVADLISTSTGKAPYNFAVFSGFIIFPLVWGYGLDVLIHFLTKLPNLLHRFSIVIFGVILILQIARFLITYLQYPQYSADYWGWQYGPKPIIDYFLKQQDRYDNLYLTGYFNQAQVFLPFYDSAGKCQKCQIGGISSLDPTRKQLFSFRVTEFNTLDARYKKRFKLKQTVALPNGQTEYILGIFK